MEITEKTYVSEILKEYGDIAEIMEMFGIRRVGALGIRKVLTRFITVKTAAIVHRVPLDKFIEMLKYAVKQKKAV